jgi:hypothetical protein
MGICQIGREEILKKGFLAVGLLAALLTSGACTKENVTQISGGQAKPCDRACLEGFADQYLAALVAHNASQLPLAANARYTENGQDLGMNDGMWQVATAIGDKKLYFTDTQSGQVGYRGIVEENGRKQIVMTRIQVENQQIREIEALVLRGGSFNNPAGLVDHPIFLEALPSEDRPPRKDLVSIANSYFEGLEKNLGNITPFSPDCTRIENGTITANNPKPTMMPFHKQTCGEQFKIPGFSAIITRVRERRFPIVDEERGLVYAIVFFDHAGLPEVKLPDGSIRKIEGPPFNAPFCFMIGELFKIKNRQITRIEATVIEVPYGMPSGWSKSAGESR